MWLHVIRSEWFFYLKWWLWWNIKSISWFGFKRMTWLASRYVFKLSASDRKWLPVVFTGLCSSSSSTSSSYEPAAVLHFKWSLSDLRATTSLWLQPHCQTIGARISHCTFCFIQMKWWQRWTHTRNTRRLTWNNIVCAREWSTEIKHNVWTYAMYLSNCCLGT